MQIGNFYVGIGKNYTAEMEVPMARAVLGVAEVAEDGRGGGGWRGMGEGCGEAEIDPKEK